jgi:hypothetical protein
VCAGMLKWCRVTTLMSLSDRLYSVEGDVLSLEEATHYQVRSSIYKKTLTSKI